MRKFSDYLFAPGVRPLSIAAGVLIGLLTSMFSDWIMGCFVGATSVLILSFAIPVIVFLQDVPYNRIKKQLSGPFIFDERVRFDARGANVSGYFILTEERMIFLAMEKGKHRLELSRADVCKISKDENYCINIYLNEREFVRVQTPVVEEMLRVLSEKGWG